MVLCKGSSAFPEFNAQFESTPVFILVVVLLHNALCLPSVNGVRFCSRSRVNMAGYNKYNLLQIVFKLESKFHLPGI